MFLGEVRFCYSQILEKTTSSGQGPENDAGHSRILSSSTEDRRAGNSETPCEETAPPWEQNRNILSFSESWMKVEVLSSEGLGSLIC